ncbi:MAG: PQQ-binding-like beta-propeller repeat protein [Deltaproteobacteria bacterium]|nr:PQQ-binding-like beta-propeller repeat protein [Deltaproteobacteria bacterium]
MRLVEVRCPKCGATVSVEDGATTASCEYCGTQSVVSRRTRFLERKLPPSQATRMPVAIQRHSTKWVMIIAIAIPGLLALGAGFIPFILKGKLGGGGLSEFWGGGHPTVADVNGDGTADIVGLVHDVQGDDATRVIVYDGKSGDSLWESQSFGQFRDVSQAKIGVAGNRVVLALTSGSAAALDLATGKLAWKGAPLGEKAARLCAAGDEQVAVETADKRRVVLALTDGAVRSDEASEGDQRCEPLWGRDRDSQRGLYVSRFPYRSHKNPGELGDQMNVDWSMTTGDGVFIALGTKKKGTRIPFVGAYQSTDGEAVTKVLWASQVPGQNPLDADTGDPDHASVSDGVAYVGYETKDDVVRVAAFEVATGKRLWDAAIPKPERGSQNISGLGALPDAVVVSTWTGLFVLERKDASIRIHKGL